MARANQTKPNQKMSKEHERAVKTVAKGAGIAFFGLFLGKLFAYLTRVFIARTMGPEAYGLISIGLAIVSILATLALLGFNQGLTRFIAFYLGKKKPGKVKGGIKSAFKISLPLSILLAAILFVFSPQVALFFSKPELIPIIQIFSFSLPFFILMTLSHSSLLGFGLIKQKVYTVEMGKNLSTLFFVVIFFIMGLGLLGVTTGFVLGFLISSFIGLYYLKNMVHPKIKKIKTTLVTREIILFSWPLLIVAALSLVLTWTDVLMLGYFTTATDVGVYEAALNTAILLSFVLQAFSFIIVPVISGFYSQKRISEIRKIYKISTRWIFSIVFPLFLILFLFPDNLIKLLFGKEFIPGSASLIILSLGFLFDVSVGPTKQTIISIGKTKIIFYLTLMTSVLNFILNFILIQIYGILGAAIALSVSLVILNLFSVLYLYNKIKLQPFDKSFLKPFFSSLTSILIVYFLTKKIFALNTWNLALAFLLFLFINCVLLLVTKSLEKEDILILKSIEKRTGLNTKPLKKIIKKII